MPHRGSLAGGPSLPPDELVWPTVHFHTVGKGEFSPAPIVPSSLPRSYRCLGVGPWPDALLLFLELSLPRGWWWWWLSSEETKVGIIETPDEFPRGSWPHPPVDA